ncbi:MaoC family dehydratase N-terminal domain-containing protein [Xanthobacter sp. DSM 24535]|uniref:FAS1-like dehydratase domain-containing protein n=1 Tax=Roseixanthobacter psychrophilus TaxID=3119917 RepID=UPI0037287D76
MAEIDRSLIGTAIGPFTVEIEKGAIRKFARAIGDDNPLYHDEAHALSLGYAGLLAPPTFPICFRPAEEAPWAAPLDRRRILAGEVWFDYERPVVSGMRLACTFVFVGVDEKPGSKGKMELIRQELRCCDPTGALVLTSGRTTIYRSLDQVEKRSLA